MRLKSGGVKDKKETIILQIQRDVKRKRERITGPQMKARDTKRTHRSFLPRGVTEFITLTSLSHLLSVVCSDLNLSHNESLLGKKHSQISCAILNTQNLHID